MLPFLRKKVHFREFRAHFRIIVFIRCAFVIHCCSILATKRPSARPFGPPSESVLNRDSFRNVVIFGQKGTFLGIVRRLVFWADSDCSATSVVELKGNCPPQRRNCSLSLATSVVELKGNCPPHFARREFQHPFGPPPTSRSHSLFFRERGHFLLSISAPKCVVWAHFGAISLSVWRLVSLN